MPPLRVCKTCLRDWRKSSQGKRARHDAKRLGVKLKEFYPGRVYYRGRSERWCDKHAARAGAANSRRRAAKLQAMPKWADSQAIKAVFAEARALTDATSILHHVDHIMPLRGKLAWGLHVHWNLRPLLASENIRKGNKLTPA